jgi:hypothetical protein
VPEFILVSEWYYNCLHNKIEIKELSLATFAIATGLLTPRDGEAFAASGDFQKPKGR